MPDEAERKGIGTSATRAATIEKLVRTGFVERKGNKKTKYLMPTHKGVALITVMPEQIQSPSMTAEWEQKLLDVEKGNFQDTEFMSEIEDMITDLVKTYKVIEDAEVLMHPVLEELKNEIGDAARIAKIDVDQHEELAARYRIQAVPTFIVFKKGEAVWRHSGVISGKDLKAVIEQNS